MSRCFERYTPILVETINLTLRDELGHAAENVDMRQLWKKVRCNIYLYVSGLREEKLTNQYSAHYELWVKSLWVLICTKAVNGKHLPKI